MNHFVLWTGAETAERDYIIEGCQKINRRQIKESPHSSSSCLSMVNWGLWIPRSAAEQHQKYKPDLRSGHPGPEGIKCETVLNRSLISCFFWKLFYLSMHDLDCVNICSMITFGYSRPSINWLKIIRVCYFALQKCTNFFFIFILCFIRQLIYYSNCN